MTFEASIKYVMDWTTPSSENKCVVFSTNTTNIPKILKSVFVAALSFIITEFVILVITRTALYTYPFVFIDSVHSF